MANKPRMLPTTIDNPYSPFDDWTRWYLEDLRLGYDTCGLLARLAPSFSEIDNSGDDVALRLLIQYNYSGKHIAVVPEDYNPLLTVDRF